MSQLTPILEITHRYIKSAFAFVFTIACCLPVFAQPVIGSFSPSSGAAGTTVTVTGSNFSATPSANIVYFGAVKATVSAASTTSLSVVVPTAATNQPITVTVGGLTAYSPASFIVNFPNNGPFTQSSFGAKADFVTGSFPAFSVVTDFDGDGKPDMAIPNYNSTTVSVFRNTGTGSIAFAPKIDLTTGSDPMGSAAGDINGDGKPDLVVVNNSGTTGSVFINTSTAGAISFAAKVNITTNNASNEVGIGDIDGDGKPDVVVTDNNLNVVSVFRNTTVGGVVSFAAKIDFPAGANPASIAISDLDGDGMVDLSIGNNTAISVLRNTSTPGNVSFAAKTDLAISDYAGDVFAGDLDQDGKTDLVVTIPVFYASVFRNTSTPGTISFAPKMDIYGNQQGGSCTIGDLDGDGKPDLAVTDYAADVVSLFRNTSTAGTISFTAHIDYATDIAPQGVHIADFDGNGRPDILVINSFSDSLSIFVNNANPPVISNFSPNTGATGTVVTITGTNFAGATAVSIGGAAASLFTVVSPTTISATVGAGTQGVVSVTTPYGTATLDGYGYTPVISSISPLSGLAGTTVTITGTNFSVTAANNIVYFGGVKANVVSATPTVLRVTVPLGAAWAPVSVTTHNLTAYSLQPFSLTFQHIGAAFASNAMDTSADYASGSGPFDVAIGDLDGDFKNDVVITNGFDNTWSAFRSTGTNGAIHFAAPLSFPASSPVGVALADINGDGKLDVAIANSDSLAIFRNTSTPGTISFAPPVNIWAGGSILHIAVTDFNGDGRPDFAVTAGAGLSVLANTGSAGVIAFDAPLTYSAGYNATGVAVGDLDGDGKPDAAVTAMTSAVNDNGYISVFRNTSANGVISFAAKTDFPTGHGANALAIGDVDADGKPDIAVTNQNSNTLSVFRNTGTPGTISLAAKTDYSTGSVPYTVVISDIDGDGKPDLAVANYNTRAGGLYKNIGTPGAPAFAAAVNYTVSDLVVSLAMGDLDGDGKPDLAFAGYGGDVLSVIRNRVNEPWIVPAGASPISGDVVNIITVDPSVQTYNATPYVQRHYDIVPAINAATATATVTLYYTQQEFDNFNAFASHGADLPKNPTDAAGIANLRIYQYHGLSATNLPGSYSGSGVQIDPIDTKVVWNATAQWWAVTIDVTGFSGFFASNATFVFSQPAAPTISATGPLSFCQGGSVILTSSASANNQWYKDGNLVAGAVSVSYQAVTTGTYSVTTTSNSVASPQSAGVVITVTALPAKPSITYNGTNLVSGSASGNQWFLEGSAISGATGQLYKPVTAGNYTVTVTAGGCTSPASDKYNYAVTGIVTIDNLHFIRLSPNPVIDRVLLDFNVAGAGTLTLQFIDMNGRLFSTRANVPAGTELDLSGLAHGLYIVKISGGAAKTSYTMKLLKL